MLESMDLGISRIEHFNEQDTHFGGQSLNITSMPQMDQIKGFGQGPVVGRSNLNPNFKSIIGKYKHKGMNSLFVIPAKSQSIYILDFKK